MRAHQLDANGVILNTIEVDSLDFMPGLVDGSAGGRIGDRWVGGAPVQTVPPAPVVAVPSRIPMLNAHLELIEAGWMPAVDAFIDAMQEPTRSLARTYLDHAQTMVRDHPLVKAIPAAIGKSELEVDLLFVRAGARDA